MSWINKPVGFRLNSLISYGSVGYNQRFYVCNKQIYAKIGRNMKYLWYFAIFQLEFTNMKQSLFIYFNSQSTAHRHTKS